MNQSKITSVFNQALYVLIPIILLLVLWNEFSYLILILLMIYLFFLLIKNAILFLFVIFCLFLFSYQYKNVNELVQAKIDSKITCQIDSIPQYKNNQHQFYCQNEHQILVQVKDEEHINTFKIGQTVFIEGEPTPIKNNTIPHLFNYAHYYLSKKVAYRVYPQKIEIVDEVSTFRYKVINFIIDYYKDLEYKEYVYAVLIGSRSDFDEEVNTSIQNLNISHLFVVSGFHVHFIYLILKRLLRALKMTKETSIRVISVFLVLFMILNNFATSIVRSVFLILLINLKNKYHLNISNIHLLSLICIVNLFINPFMIYDTGFQLSYLITYILLLSHNILLNQKNKFISIFQICIIAQLFSLPISANFDFHFNFFSVILSPILGLYYTYVIFPISIFLSLFKDLEFLLKYGIVIFEVILNYLNQFKGLDYNVGYFSVFRSTIYYLSLFFIFKKWELKQKNLKMMLVFMMVMFFYHSLSIEEKVTFMDVAQGDSALIHSPLKSCSALIDTGGVGDFSATSFHPGERNVVPYLQSMQIKTLDYLILSHSDKDHAGDYQFIMDKIKVKALVLNPYENDEFGLEIKDYAKKKGIKIIEVKANESINCGDIQLFILNPTSNYQESNDNSLVVYFKLNEDDYLFTGDISQKVEEELIKTYDYSIDYLKVSHHGSKNASSEAFLKHFKVKTGIISVGKNYYHHPTIEVLNLLNKFRIKTYRTDLDGSISVKYYLGRKCIIKTFEPDNNSS